MTWQVLATGILLTLGVGVELLCCLGLVLMRNVFDRLHYLGPATLLGPLLIALAVVAREALSQAGIKALLIALVLAVVSPVVTHATGRAARLRSFGTLAVGPEDRRDDGEPRVGRATAAEETQ
ncbi:MAG: hypothetical protein NVSMB65_08330 [Chloroflexota bacterium]